MYRELLSQPVESVSFVSFDSIAPFEYCDSLTIKDETELRMTTGNYLITKAISLS